MSALGHGMQIDGDNYLNAIDTDFSDERRQSTPRSRSTKLSS